MQDCTLCTTRQPRGPLFRGSLIKVPFCRGSSFRGPCFRGPCFRGPCFRGPGPGVLVPVLDYVMKKKLFSNLKFLLLSQQIRPKDLFEMFPIVRLLVFTSELTLQFPM